jgi:hypothetical protein
MPKLYDAEIDAVVGRLWRLRELAAKGEPAERREAFRLLVSRIDLRFDKVKKGKRTECPFRSGEIHLRTEDGIFGSVSRDDRRSFERLIATIIDAGLSLNHDSGATVRILRLSA